MMMMALLNAFLLQASLIKRALLYPLSRWKNILELWGETRCVLIHCTARIIHSIMFICRVSRHSGAKHWNVWNGVSQGALGSDDLACFVSEESSRQEPRRTEMAFTNLRPAVASAPAADDEQHYLLVWRWIFDSNKNSSCIREPFKNYLADFVR